MKNGYIKLYRVITDWRWYNSPNTMRVFLHLLLTVKYEEADIQTSTVGRGQGLYTVKQLSEELNLTEQNVRTALDHLKSTGEVTTSKCSKKLLITVQNYDWYQGGLTRSSTRYQRDNKEKEGEKERKKEKNQKKIKKEKDQEIRNIQEGEEARARKTRTGAHAREAEEQVKALFNSACSPLPRLTFLTKKRREAIAALLDSFSFEDVRQAFQNAGKSDFLTGGNSRKWKANFDWLTNEDNFVKVLEGAYNDDKHGTFDSFDTNEAFMAALIHSYSTIDYSTIEKKGE